MWPYLIRIQYTPCEINSFGHRVIEGVEIEITVTDTILTKTYCKNPIEIVPYTIALFPNSSHTFNINSKINLHFVLGKHDVFELLLKGSIDLNNLDKVMVDHIYELSSNHELTRQDN